MILNEHPDSNQYPGVRAIGFWRDKCGPQVEELRHGLFKGHQGYVLNSMPDPKDYIDGLWDASLRGDRAMVVAHLKTGRSVAAYKGWSTCRICGLEPNGSEDLTDSVFVWPEGFAHYVEAHRVRPPVEFVEHVRAWNAAKNRLPHLFTKGI